MNPSLYPSAEEQEGGGCATTALSKLDSCPCAHLQAAAQPVQCWLEHAAACQPRYMGSRRAGNALPPVSCSAAAACAVSLLPKVISTGAPHPTTTHACAAPRQPRCARSRWVVTPHQLALGR